MYRLIYARPDDGRLIDQLVGRETSALSMFLQLKAENRSCLVLDVGQSSQLRVAASNLANIGDHMPPAWAVEWGKVAA